MTNKLKTYNRIIAVVVFIVLPIIIYLTGGFSTRAMYKEAISLLTIVSFFIMLLQFYLSRVNKAISKVHKLGKVIKWHKALGYIFVGVLIFHPFLVILPQYFESGIGLNDAFFTLLDQWNTQGVLLGIIAWITMIALGITSFFRNNLGMSYKVWRIFHGILSIVFIVAAVFHVIDMGRHINIIMIVVIAILSIGALIPLLQSYLFEQKKS